MVNSGRKRYDGRFVGARLNLESVPRLPAIAVRYALDDPLRRPWLFVWRRGDRPINGVGEIVEAVVLRRHDRFRQWPRGPSAELWSGPASKQGRSWVEVGTFYRRLPRGTGVELLLICFSCQRPKRFLYRWAKSERGGAQPIHWSCRGCAGLRFASEGQCPDWLGFDFPRQEPWTPYVFSSLKEGARFLRVT